MILKVDLKNWKSHGEKNGSFGTIVQFERGLNVIYGVNGSGKSSVAEAVAYALFGESPDFKRVLRSGKERGEVRLLFEAGGIYEVRRSFTARGTEESELFQIEDGKRIPIVLQRAKEISLKVEEILGVSKDLFLRAVYGEQNRITDIYDRSDRERAKMFDRVLAIDELTAIRDVLQRAKNGIEKRLKAVNVADLLRKKKELEEEISELTRELVEVEKRISEGEQERKHLEEEKEEILKAFSEVEEKWRQLLELQEERNKILGIIQTLKSSITYPDAGQEDEERYRQLESERERILALLKREDALRRRVEYDRERLKGMPRVEEVHLKELREEEARKKAELEGIEKELEDLRKEVLEGERELSRIRESILNLKKKEAELENKRGERKEILSQIERGSKELEEELKKLKDLLARKRGELVITEHITVVLEGSNRCPVCGTELSREKVKELLEESGEKKKALEKEVEEIDNAIRSLEENVARINSLRGRMESLEEMIKNLEEEVKRRPELERRMDDIQRRIEELNGKKERLEERRNALRREMEEIQEKLRREVEKEALMRERKKIEEDLKRSEEELKGVEESLEGYRKRWGFEDVEEFQEVIKNVDERYRSYKARKELQEKEAALKRLEREIEGLKDAETAYKETQERLKEIEKALSKLEEEIRGMESLLKEKKRRIQDKEKNLEEVEESLKEVEKRKAMADKMKKLIIAWEETMKRVREERIQAVNRALKLVWRKVYLSQYGDYTDIDFRVEQKRDAYTYKLLVKTKERGKEVWREVGNLSGGEKTLALIALRVAISYLLSGRARFLLMDEPTHNLDENLTRKLSEFLKEATEEGNLFDQIIVITHDPIFSKHADVVYRFEREKSGDDPTRVVREL